MILLGKQYLMQNGYSRSSVTTSVKTPLGDCILRHNNVGLIYKISKNIATARKNKKLSYCWETVRRESMPRIAKMDVEMTT